MSTRRSSRLSGINSDQVPNLDSVLKENKKRRRTSSSSSGTQLLPSKSTKQIVDLSEIASIAEEENTEVIKIDESKIEPILVKTTEKKCVNIEATEEKNIEANITEASEVDESRSGPITVDSEEKITKTDNMESNLTVKEIYVEEITHSEDMKMNNVPTSSIQELTEENIDGSKINNVSDKKEKVSKREPEIRVKGRCKSGRFWKSERDRFRSVIKSKGLKQNFKNSLKLKEDRKRVKAYEQLLKESAKKEKEDLRARQEENKKKREENQRKCEIFQEIKNPAKLKRMKKKQLRMIAKRDTVKIQP